MKDIVKRFKDLSLIGKILAVPGLFIAGVVLLIVSPFLLFFAMIAYTSEVLGLDDPYG